MIGHGANAADEAGFEHLCQTLAHLLAGDAKLLPHGVVGARHQRQATLGGGHQGAVEIVKRHGLLRWLGAGEA